MPSGRSSRRRKPRRWRRCWTRPEGRGCTSRWRSSHRPASVEGNSWRSGGATSNSTGRVNGESAPILRVTASLQRIDGKDVFLPRKTDLARRTVGLPPAAVALLRRHRREQLERRVLLGEGWTDLDLVIDRSDGEPFPAGSALAGLVPPRSPGRPAGSAGSMICAMHSQRGCSRPLSTPRS